jgi:hypothetical protein
MRSMDGSVQNLSHFGYGSRSSRPPASPNLKGSQPATPRNPRVIRRAFESACIEFIDENGGGPGVRLRKRQRAKQPEQIKEPGELSTGGKCGTIPP